ncbi:GNAT family N-acetyltransferase [Pedobacter insulae]|uniref:Acetyltransferase (GNAT) family protein n=1 Tax=Pedobacter insulae TaxID=414048 RepID=A0A1I3A704_9SPHI|nr:GNAT family N-acetyltransferase [Pedobacter insulae]SFH45690.1 Acetyltransferase (GNAT) family protein [Pedobacter insulae]
MITLLRTDATNTDFIALVKSLDEYLALMDGAEHSFYSQFNKITLLNNVVIAFDDNTPIGCGAFKPIDDNKVEIKRMFVKEEARGQRIASKILTELENWASALGFNHYILETGIKQTAAVALYHKMGYRQIPNYGQYEGITNSICFSKANEGHC